MSLVGDTDTGAPQPSSPNGPTLISPPLQSLLKGLVFSLLPALILVCGGEIILRLIDPPWMWCVRTHACPHAASLPRYVTEQKHNFTLETEEPLLVFHPDLFWWPRPHVQGTVWSTPHVRTNSQGLRQGPVDGRPDRINVLFVGDSVVWGSLVEEWERFTDIAASRLDSTDTTDRLQVINAGVVGFSSHQVLHLLRHRAIEQFAPRVVVVCVGINDAWRVGRSDRNESARNSQALVRAEYLLQRSNLFLFMQRYLTEAIIWTRTGINPRGLAFLYPQHSGNAAVLRVTPEETEDNLRDIDLLTQEHGARLVVILEATREEHPAGWDKESFEEGRALIRESAGLYGWPLVELSRMEDPPWNMKSDQYLLDFCHLNPSGHAIAAEWLTPIIGNLLSSLHGVRK